MSYYNVASNHPIIENSQEYALIKKFVSINSEDRDFLKFPNAASFEIELPEDMLNVSTVRLSDYEFPIYYDVFTVEARNITMTFQISNPYNPASSVLEIAILEALNANKDNNYEIIIQEGTYTGPQLATELTNKFNEAVSNYIIQYFTDHGYAGLIPSFTGYTGFVIYFNAVAQTMAFGNRSDQFILTNSTQVPLSFPLSANSACAPCPPNVREIVNKYPRNYQDNFCTPINKSIQPNFFEYGLPAYVGLQRCDQESIGVAEYKFYYENTVWLTPLYAGHDVYVVEGQNKVVLNMPTHFYLDLEGLNYIDETSPFNVSRFTLTTNESNGTVNSAFAFVFAGPSYNSWTDKSQTYKFFIPPAERIRRLKIKCRYHDGRLVQFKGLPFTILLEFTLFSPQQVRKQKMFNPQTGLGNY
jgi:hypothetical protein